MTNCECEDVGCECQMLRTIKAVAKKSVDNDLDIEKIMDMLKHYEMALHSQAIQIKLLEERVNDLEKDGRSKTSPSGQRYDNYFGDYSSKN